MKWLLLVPAVPGDLSSTSKPIFLLFGSAGAINKSEAVKPTFRIRDWRGLARFENCQNVKMSANRERAAGPERSGPSGSYSWWAGSRGPSSHQGLPHFDEFSKPRNVEPGASEVILYSERRQQQLTSAVRGGFLFHQKSYLPLLWFWCGHQLPDRIENNLELCVVFLFQVGEFPGQPCV